MALRIAGAGAASAPAALFAPFTKERILLAFGLPRIVRFVRSLFQRHPLLVHRPDPGRRDGVMRAAGILIVLRQYDAIAA